MNTLEIPDKNISINVPAHWDEMTPHHLQYVLLQAFLFTSGAISYYDFMLQSFFKLADICRNWKTLVWERMMPASVVLEKNANIFILAEVYCSFLLRKNKQGELEINYDTVVNHFPMIIVGRRTWQGPADLLTDLTFGEFRAALEAMDEYFREKEPNALDRMIACLYRPLIRYADRKPGRSPFTRENVDQLAEHVQLIPEWQRLAILLWFTNCVQYIQTEDINIEGRQISLKVLFPRREEPTGDRPAAAGLGWTSVLYAIAKEGLFGNIKETDQAGLFDVLLFLYDNYLQQQHNKK